MANILAVYVKINKWAQFTVPVEQVLAQVWMLLDQTFHDCTHIFSRYRDLRLPTGIGP
jgi:hypothetical protein